MRLAGRLYEVTLLVKPHGDVPSFEDRKVRVRAYDAYDAVFAATIQESFGEIVRVVNVEPAAEEALSGDRLLAAIEKMGQG